MDGYKCAPCDVVTDMFSEVSMPYDSSEVKHGHVCSVRVPATRMRSRMRRHSQEKEHVEEEQPESQSEGVTVKRAAAEGVTVKPGSVAVRVTAQPEGQNILGAGGVAAK